MLVNTSRACNDSNTSHFNIIHRCSLVSWLSSTWEKKNIVILSVWLSLEVNLIFFFYFLFLVVKMRGQMHRISLCIIHYSHSSNINNGRFSWLSDSELFIYKEVKGSNFIFKVFELKILLQKEDRILLFLSFFHE
jgi:hypothetical protein